MSGQKPPRLRPRPRPKGFDDVPELSDEEVERRVDVRGGAAPRGPVERVPRVPRAPRRRERTVARDSLLLIGLVIVGLVAVRVFLPDGPLSASATNAPSGTEAVLASIPTTSNGQTPGLQTLVPVITLPPGSVLPTTLVEPTAPPPTPTLAPGQTPKPTPKVTPRPTPTTASTVGPTAPNRATVLVKTVVVKDSGGSLAAGPSDWTITVTMEGGLSAPGSFAGSTAGTTVSVPAGKGFTITSNDARADFAAYPIDSACSKAFGGGGLAAGASVTCTITRDDRPRINVITNVTGGGPSAASDVQVTVSGGEATPSSFSGDETGRIVVVGFGLTFDIDMSALLDYTTPVETGTCNGTLGIGAAPATCTFTFTYVPPPPTDSPQPSLPASALTLLLLPLLRPRRWRTTTTG